MHLSPDPQDFIDLYETRMPYGKYQGWRLVNLPEPYIIWLANNGLPHGRLGELLATVHTIKVNGLDYLFDPLR